MPQLDFSTYSSQIFWLIVCFSVLLWFSGKHFLPALSKILKDRWFLIEGTRENAEKLVLESDHLFESIQNELTSARKEAHDHVMTVIRDMDQKRTHERMLLSQQSKEHTHKMALTLEKRSTAVDIESMATELAHVLSEKILGPLNQNALKKELKVAHKGES